MSNFSLVVLAAIVGALPSPSVAAPKRVDDETKQKELEVLWADLYKDEPAATSAALKLYKHADDAVALLKAKLRPLKMDADRCKQLLKDLGSDDEKVWKAAWDELDYLDPRLAIDLEKLMDEVTENPARTRMVAICSERSADSLTGKDVKIRPIGPMRSDGFNFFDGTGSWWAEHRIERIGKGAWSPKKAWTRAARGVAILEQIGTQEAVKVLEQLAEGHPDAFPTKEAKESLQRLKMK